MTNVAPAAAPGTKDLKLCDLPFASVIVPVYNGAAFLPRCLAALREQDYPAERFEIVLVFNDGRSPVSPETSAPPALRCLQEETPGSYAARNRGLLNANGSILAFTDVDCVPHPDWLSKGVRALLNNPDCGFVGGRIELVPNSSTRPSAVERYEMGVHFLQQIYVDQCRFAATANMITRREVMDRVGPFNSHLKSGGDNEWGNRAVAAGFAGLYESEAIVSHSARKLRELLRKARRLAGGIVDRQRLVGRPQTKRGSFLHDLSEERVLFRGSYSRLRSTSGSDALQDISLQLLAFTIFGLRVMERWRVRLGGKSLRT
jgi:glycosyltransferase involved in cell wall biosynthesis